MQYSPEKDHRIQAIDILRGIVILLMFLDHLRDFFTPNVFDLLDPQKTSFSWYFIRWITHFCATVFVFLCGLGVDLSKKSKKEKSLFLLTRGIWIIILEIVVVNPSFGSPVYLSSFTLQILWVIGFSMIILAGVIWLPRYVIILIASVIVIGHNAFDTLGPGDMGSFSSLWSLLHVPFQKVGPFFVIYPLIPWIGVMFFGYVFGSVMVLQQPKRNLSLYVIGGVCIVSFFILRGINGYGDPKPWFIQGRGFLFTVLSFLNTSKYPPSLLFILMTLGPGIAAIPLLEKVPRYVKTVLATFGRVPLFCYILHIPIAHVMGKIFFYIQYDTTFNCIFPQNLPADYSSNVFLVLGVWLCFIFSFYPLVWWYSNVKRRKTLWLFHYL